MKLSAAVVIQSDMLTYRYRARVAEVHSAVKRRLDYQVELVNTKKRLEQDHMVNWIVDNVVKGITPKQVIYQVYR